MGGPESYSLVMSMIPRGRVSIDSDPVGSGEAKHQLFQLSMLGSVLRWEYETMYRKMSHYGIGIGFSLALLFMVAAAGMAQGDLPAAPNHSQVGFRLDRLSVERIPIDPFPRGLDIAPLVLADYLVTRIDPLPDYERSKGYGINNSGAIVGRFYDYNEMTEAEENRQAFVWNPIDGASLLPTLDGETSAWGINDDSFASGYSTNASGFKHAVRWDTTLATILDIGTLENTNHVFGDSSVGYDLNNLEEVVGYADIPNLAGTFTPYHAFVYDDTDGIQDLGTLTTLYPDWQNGYSLAYDRTASGNTVGIANALYGTTWVFRPFIHDETSGMQELNIDPAYPTCEWYAVAINEAGRIGGHIHRRDESMLATLLGEPFIVAHPGHHAGRFPLW